MNNKVGFGLALFASLSSIGHAQTNLVAGKWAGTLDVTTPNGPEHDSAVFILKQSAGTVTGSVGESEDKLSEVKEGHLEGPELVLMFDSGNGSPMAFHLIMVGDHLKGYLVGEKMAAMVDMARVGQTPSPSQGLFDEMAHMDTVLFDAYNHRDLEKIKGLFTRDMEFYHDKWGLSLYDENMANFKKTFDGTTRMRRELVPGSLEVYPLKGYGAVEIGVHRFYATAPGQKEQLTATAKFVHVWQQKDGEWKLARVVSYDHR